MANAVQIPQGLLTAEGQVTQIPDKQERARQFAKWCQEYEGITVGEYPNTHMGIITVTVAGATFAYHTWEFPTVDLYVKIALAVNTGNLKEREAFTYNKLKRMYETMNGHGYVK
jgi:acyl-CoA reductase-like NAD-dependent aldehyde dehydrogenase